MTPLFTAERQLEIDHGVDELMRRFDRAEMGFVFDPTRKNVAAK